MTNCMIETARLTLRRFRSEDWADLLEIARSKETSPYAYTDHTWPTDEAWAKASASYMATDDAMWAMECKEDGRVFCFVNCNGINADGYMDIGHVMNRAYAGRGYEEEGLRALFRRVLETADAAGITAVWAAEDTEKTAPLLALGMKPVSQNTADAFDGSGRTFTACRLSVSREEWAAHSP